MVNWREDIEFCYILAMLVAGVVTFFGLYEWTGMIFAAGADVVLIICMAIAGYVAFETDWAIARWDKIAEQLRKSSS